jgi:hypothetical protein
MQVRRYTSIPNLVFRCIIFGTKIDQLPNQIFDFLLPIFGIINVSGILQKTEKSPSIKSIVFCDFTLISTKIGHYTYVTIDIESANNIFEILKQTLSVNYLVYHISITWINCSITWLYPNYWDWSGKVARRGWKHQRHGVWPLTYSNYLIAKVDHQTKFLVTNETSESDRIFFFVFAYYFVYIEEGES